MAHKDTVDAIPNALLSWIAQSHVVSDKGGPGLLLSGPSSEYRSVVRRSEHGNMQINGVVKFLGMGL
jgi:hypothetical protein